MTRHLSRSVRLRIDGAVLDGHLTLPAGATTLVAFVEGGWGVQYASRENRIADRFRRRGLGTLLIDLITPEEDRERSDRAAVDLRSRRLAGVVDWTGSHEETAGLETGIFGVGTGAGVALSTAKEVDGSVGAVVTLNGRFDGVEDGIPAVTAPTHLLVDASKDGLDRHNRAVSRRLNGGGHQCSVLRTGGDPAGNLVPQVGRLATDWYRTHLRGRDRAAGEA